MNANVIDKDEKTTHPRMYKKDRQRDKDRIMKRKQVRLATHVVSRIWTEQNTTTTNTQTLHAILVVSPTVTDTSVF